MQYHMQLLHVFSTKADIFDQSPQYWGMCTYIYIYMDIHTWTWYIWCSKESKIHITFGSEKREVWSLRCVI